jgi:valyl-tRNA synthetase
MPHITEELWSLLEFGESSIQFALPPEKIRLDDVWDLTGKRQLVSSIYQTIQAGRNLRAESKLPSNRRIRFILRTDEKLVSSQIPTLTRLLNAEDMELDPKYQVPAGNPVAVTPLGEISLTVAAADRAGERQRLDKEIARIEVEMRAVEEKLGNQSFIDRAPVAIVEEHRHRLKSFSAQLEKLKHAREGLN